MAERAEAERAKMNAEKMHAAKQPHRVDLPDPLGTVTRENALEVFCLAYKIRDEWRSAGVTYRNLAQMYLASIDADGLPSDGLGSGEMSDERVAEIEEKYFKAQRAVMRVGANRLTAINKITKDNVILSNARADHIKDALGALAVHFGIMPARR